MDSAMTMNNSSFLLDLNAAKDKTKRRIKDQYKDVKLNILKEALKNANIKYDDTTTSLGELKSSLKANLTDYDYNRALDVFSKIDSSFDNMLKTLGEGATDSLSKFFNTFEKVSKPIAKVGAKSLASRTALILAPTMVSKLVVGGALTANAVYKMVKNRKEGKVVDEAYQCDRVLQELEVSRNNNGDVLDTRFNEDVQEEIRKFLKDNNISFNDFGYLSLRETIYSLDTSKKKELCNIINQKLGNKVDVNLYFDKVRDNFFDKIKKDFKKIGATSAAAVGAATAVNSVDPAIIAAPVNGFLAGMGVSSVTDNPLLIGTGGLGGGVLTSVAESLPLFGKYFENAFALENLAISGVVGVGAGVVGVAGASLISLVKGLKDKFNTQVDRNNILKIDGEKYLENNKEELRLIQENLLSKENSIEEQAIVDLVYNYMVDENIHLSRRPKNVLEFSNLLKELNPQDKRKVLRYIDKLKNYNSENYNDFINMITKAGNVASTVALLGLSGLSIYDIIKDGEFLPELSAKLFKDVPNNIYLMIPEKTMINSLDYRNDFVNSESKVAMIADKDLAATENHYKELLSMTMEEGTRTQVAQNVGNDFEMAAEDFKFGVKSFIENPVESVSTGVKTAKENINTMFNNLKEAVSDGKLFDGSGLRKVVSYVKNEKVLIPNEAAIEAYINSLSIDEKVNLAYYFNNSINVDPGDINYESIALAIQKHLPEIQTAIENYNEKMIMLRASSDAVTAAGVILPGVEEIDKNVK